MEKSSGMTNSRQWVNIGTGIWPHSVLLNTPLLKSSIALSLNVRLLGRRGALDDCRVTERAKGRNRKSIAYGT